MPHSNLPTSRKVAIAQQSKLYFTGKPCKHGHVAARLVSWGCSDCLHANNTNETKKKVSLAYYYENKEKRNEYDRQYRADNKQRISVYSQRREKENREKITERKRSYYRTPKGKVISLVYRLLRRTLLLEKKKGKAIDVLGYTTDELRRHLEGQFKDGMTWENHGTLWHVDHITPISHYLAMGVTDPKTVNALSNLQPLLAEDNLSKSNKLNWGVETCASL